MLDSHFGVKTSRLPLFAQRDNGRHYVTLLNLYTPTGLSILLHGVISLPDAPSGDKK